MPSSSPSHVLISARFSDTAGQSRAIIQRGPHEMIDPHKRNLNRRDVVCGGGAFVFGILVASLLGGSKPVRAQPIARDVPEVDRVSVRVVTDSYQFAVLAGGKTGDVEVQHFRRGLSLQKPPGQSPIRRFGLA